MPKSQFSNIKYSISTQKQTKKKMHQYMTKGNALCFGISWFSDVFQLTTRQSALLSRGKFFGDSQLLCLPGGK